MMRRGRTAERGDHLRRPRHSLRPLAEERPDPIQIPRGERPIDGLGLSIVRMTMDDVIHVGENVMEVFEITGFVDILTIE